MAQGESRSVGRGNDDEESGGVGAPAPLPWVAVVVVYGIVLIALVAMWIAHGGDHRFNGVEITVAEGFVALAVFYICAQAIERLVEPIMTWEPWARVASGGQSREREQLKRQVSMRSARSGVLAARAAATPSDGLAGRAVDGGSAADAAADAAGAASESKAELAREEKKRGLIGWGVAALLAIALTWALELRLMDAVADFSADGAECVSTEGKFTAACARIARVDLVVTALAIAGGTKPLHDLITRLEKAKSNADEATRA